MREFTVGDELIPGYRIEAMAPTGDGRIAFDLRDPDGGQQRWLYPADMPSGYDLRGAVELGTGLRETIDAERELAPRELFGIGSMLSYDERLLLHWAARTGPAGAIVDLGSFLGGSTLALACGARNRPEPPPVHAYDLFELRADWERAWLPDGFAVDIGGSTRQAFEHNIASVRDLVNIHEGDIRQQSWQGPIGVLFIDIAKSWSTADAVWRTFLPALIPGESLVIQQDLVHWGHPWCAITMELLADRFEYLGWVWFSSAVYRSTAPVTPADLPVPMRDAVSLREALELVDRAAARFGEPIAGSVRLSGTIVLGTHGQYDAARDRVREIRADYATAIPYIEEGFASLNAWIDDVEGGRIVLDQNA